MLKIFICEDNIKQRKYLENIIEKVILIEELDMEMRLSTSDPNEILQVLDDNSFTGVYFLDIDLGTDINGIQLAEKIRKYDPRGFIIFITTHAEMSYLTFKYKVEAMDYIIKDNYESIEDKVKECIIRANERYAIKDDEFQKTFSIKVDNRIIAVNYDSILFFETSSIVHKIIMHCENRQVEFYSNMSTIMDSLDERFSRCHTSYIVNRNKIAEIDKKNRIAYMTNGEECLVSVRGMKNLI